MEYVRFGNTGMKVSRICLGCMSYGGPTERWQWALNEEQSRPFIKHALELGINFFDTANVCSFGASEEVVGKALREFATRDEVVIATKVRMEMSPAPNGWVHPRSGATSAATRYWARFDLYRNHSKGISFSPTVT